MPRVRAGLNCAICFNDAPPDSDWVVVHPCAHIFHDGCIRQWVNSTVEGARSNRKQNTCPTCREKLAHPAGLTRSGKKRSRFAKLHFESLHVTQDASSSSSPTRARLSHRGRDAIASEADPDEQRDSAGPWRARTRAIHVVRDSDDETPDAGPAQNNDGTADPEAVGAITESESDEDNARPARLVRGTVRSANTRTEVQPGEANVARQAAQILELQAQLARAVQELADTKRQQDEWRQTEQAELEGRIAELGRAMQQKDVDIKRYKDESKALVKTCKKEAERCVKLTDQMKRMTAELSDVKEQYSVAKVSLESVNMAHAELQETSETTYDELRIRYERSKAFCDKLEAANITLTEQKAKYKARIADLKLENQVLKADLGSNKLHKGKGRADNQDDSDAPPQSSTMTSNKVVSRFFGSQVGEALPTRDRARNTTPFTKRKACDFSDDVPGSVLEDESLRIIDVDTLPDELGMGHTRLNDDYSFEDLDAALRHRLPMCSDCVPTSEARQSSKKDSIAGASRWIDAALKGKQSTMGERKKPKLRC